MSETVRPRVGRYAVQVVLISMLGMIGALVAIFICLLL